MNERNQEQLIARTLRDYALKEIPDNPNPWPELRSSVLLASSPTARKQITLLSPTSAGVRQTAKPFNKGAHRVNIATGMIVLVVVVIAAVAALYYAARPLPGLPSVAQAPTSSVAIGEAGLPGALIPPAQPTESLQAEQMVGRRAPDASLTDVRTGEATSLSSFSGKTVLLTMWFTRCAPCRSVAASIQQVYDKYKDKAEFVSVSFGPIENAARVKTFIDQNSYPWTFLHASDVAMIPYPAQAAPTTYFIGSDGIIYAAYVGEMDVSTLIATLESDPSKSLDLTNTP